MYCFFSKKSLEDKYFSFERIRNVYCIPHIHCNMEIVFVLDGNMQLIIGKKVHMLSENAMAVVMPYEIHEFKTHGNSEMFIVGFPPKYFSEYKNVFEGKTFGNPKMKISSVLTDLLTEFMNSDKDIFRKKSFVYYVMSEFLKNSELINGKMPDDIFIKAVMYINENSKGEITLEKTASSLGVTSVHLSRLFSKKAGFCFTEFVNLVRLKEAAELLKNTDFSISEVALESGFGSIRNFNRVFKKYYKCTPKDMRNSEY